MISPTQMHLILFFTDGLSLRAWHRIGMMDREVALYKSLCAGGWKVSFVTYGNAKDKTFEAQLGGIQILCNRWNLPRRIYKLLLPILHHKAFRSANVIKTNQTSGALQALRTARLWRKPLVARGGYLWSALAKQMHGQNSDAAQHALETETRVFQSAHRIVVTTAATHDAIIERIPDVQSRIQIIPNYVDTEVFKPASLPITNDIIFIGRLHPIKNLFNLLQAIEDSNYTLKIIGQGPLESELHERFGTLDGRIEWVKMIRNYDLPDEINRSRLFVLLSQHEGHPKVVIEAMACGSVVLGSNVSGIREIIQHGENGWLCDTSPESIRAAINHLLSDDNLRQQLGKAARAYALEHYALGKIIHQEENMLKQVITEYQR